MVEVREGDRRELGLERGLGWRGGLPSQMEEVDAVLFVCRVHERPW